MKASLKDSWLFLPAQAEVLKSLVSGGHGSDSAIKDHVGKKCNGPNSRHCQEVATLTATLPDETLASIRGKFGYTRKQMLWAATGRPLKAGQCGSAVTAKEQSINLLKLLREASGQPAGTSQYTVGNVKYEDTSKPFQEVAEKSHKVAANYLIAECLTEAYKLHRAWLKAQRPAPATRRLTQKQALKLAYSA